jgi:hypothetical protein
MSLRRALTDFVITFIVTLAVAVGVTFLWSLVFHGAGAIDWETAFRLAIIFGLTFGIVLPWAQARERNAVEK